MKIHYKHITLSIIFAFLLFSYAPKTFADKLPEQKQVEKPGTSLMYPENLGKPRTPQQERLKINEDNVMNPYP